MTTKRALSLSGVPVPEEPKPANPLSAYATLDEAEKYVQGEWLRRELAERPNEPPRNVTRADFALAHAECPMNPAVCEHFLPRDARNDYCRWCGGAAKDHAGAVREAFFFLQGKETFK